jgi:ribosomal protein L14E/L6E/L27E
MKNSALPEIGQAVRSVAGRDKGRLLIVMALADDLHALVADGDLRKAAAPKKKKIRHLKYTPHIAEGVRQKLLSRAAVCDKELRTALKSIEPCEEG